MVSLLYYDDLFAKQLGVITILLTSHDLLLLSNDDITKTLSGLI